MNKQECPFLSDAGVINDNANSGIEICLNCELPRCVYEVTTRGKREIRQAQVKVLGKERKSNAEMARLLGVSERTIRDDVKANRNEDCIS